MKLPKIFIIILNWNHPEDTLECIKSIESVSIKDYELYVEIIDNGSSDESVKHFKEYRSDKFKIEIIENNKNLGFAGGNNVGINNAINNNADFLFILNNDTVVDINIINELLIASKKYPEVGIFSPKIYFTKGYEFHKKYKREELGRVIWSAGGSIDWDNVYATNSGVDAVDNGQFNKDKEIDFATGAALFIRSEVINKIGNFDERYFMYFEDVDLCKRYKRDGGLIMFINKAVLWHKVAQSSGIGSELNDYFITRNRLLFGNMYAPFRAKLALYKESVKFLLNGRKWQKKGVMDYYLANFGKGSWITANRL
jgi:GT2 family glycosyltransferase